MAAFLDNCRFNPTLGGTTDWTYSSAVAGYQSPAAAVVVNGTKYKYFAIDGSNNWELGEGAYNTGTGVLPRTTVLFNSLGTTAKINFPAAPQVAIVALKEDIISVEEANSFTTAQQSQARGNIGVPADNLIINGDFRINQVAYVSGATLAAAAYGHDQWKAGASGGDYSFTQLKSSTQITIAASKSLIQPIEDANVAGGTYVLTWTGTAQARAGVNTLTPSGSYASSPLVIAGQTVATAMSVEFNAGTLGTVKLEPGTIATPFMMRPFEQELTRCKRFYEKSYDLAVAPGTANSISGLTGQVVASNTIVNLASYGGRNYAVQKRASPTVKIWGYQGTATAVSDANPIDLAANSGGVAGTSGPSGFMVQNISGGSVTTTNNFVFFHWAADARL